MSTCAICTASLHCCTVHASSCFLRLFHLFPTRLHLFPSLSYRGQHNGRHRERGSTRSKISGQCCEAALTLQHCEASLKTWCPGSAFGLVKTHSPAKAASYMESTSCIPTWSKTAIQLGAQAVHSRCRQRESFQSGPSQCFAPSRMPLGIAMRRQMFLGKRATCCCMDGGSGRVQRLKRRATAGERIPNHHMIVEGLQTRQRNLILPRAAPSSKVSTGASVRPLDVVKEELMEAVEGVPTDLLQFRRDVLNSSSPLKRRGNLLTR